MINKRMPQHLPLNNNNHTPSMLISIPSNDDIGVPPIRTLQHFGFIHPTTWINIVILKSTNRLTG